MLGIAEHRGDGAGFDDVAIGHDADAVGDAFDHAQIMGDEQHGHAEALLQRLEQVEDLGLHGDVERGGGLVGDEQVGLVGERHGDHDALALAARKLVRIGGEAAGRVGNADLVEQFEGAGAGGVGGQAFVNGEHFADLALDGVDRIERGHRLLEDHRDVVAAHRAQFALPEAASRSWPLKRTWPEWTAVGGRSCRMERAVNGFAGAAFARPERERSRRGAQVVEGAKHVRATGMAL